jgi:hypothetical protein
LQHVVYCFPCGACSNAVQIYRPQEFYNCSCLLLQSYVFGTHSLCQCGLQVVAHCILASNTTLCVQVLNRIIEHSGAQGAQPFTREMVETVQGYDGSYSPETTSEEAEAIQKLRQVFDKPMRDLDHLLSLYSLDEFFTGLDAEI